MGLKGHESSGNNMFDMGVISMHKRSHSHSFPDKRELQENKMDHTHESSDCLRMDTKHLKSSTSMKTKPLRNSEARNTLRREILQLEKRLQNQVAIRGVLEKALGYNSISLDIGKEISIPKLVTELVKDISVLELEVGHLEQYLLSLYRQAFDQQVTSTTPVMKDGGPKLPKSSPREKSEVISGVNVMSNIEKPSLRSDCQSIIYPQKDLNDLEDRLIESGVYRCRSFLSQHSTLSAQTSPPAEPLGRDVRACYSQPLSMMEYEQNTSSNIISLAEHLGTRISDHVPETPNKLSEDMIQCVSEIYCKLADPPLSSHGLLSPASSSSSMSAFSPNDYSGMWSPGLRNYSSLDERLDNPFHVQGLKEFSGPYSTMVEVQYIYRNDKKLAEVEHMLQNFRFLISRLEEIDPKKMTHSEKLAFWINVHNALMMHAYLAYGIPRNNVKRLFILLKAAYNIGGHIVSVNLIQSSILGCQMSRPGQWIQMLLSSKSKFKSVDERQAYSIDHPEPLLHFALCSGSHSDPAVRVYTPKTIAQELEAAKNEYIRATFGVSKDFKILLPKLVESFAKDSDLCPTGTVEMIQKSLPQSVRKSIKKCHTSKPKKIIQWVPHNFSFRYLISKDLEK
ncbi:Ternary complex factor MIP1, leucine-zipper [Heracleum sosnowskyi]|uniref:Ternary complex factor MIP1, leucine-zipper n=1 Tax=Heracleum sosnowskyi TaxID=360622 RepID=A0AAD8IDX2_9APIA|nr:Ternary complex factor MIP1, leucine-zipper [Heracleum sosnowskyi]